MQQQQSVDNSIAQSGGVGPGSTYLRSMVMQPNTLTPAQQTQLADLRRTTANQIHGSDFAGSGRTAAALFDKTENGFVNSAMDQNKQQSISAADKLASTSNAAAEAGAAAGVTGATTEGNADLATGKLLRPGARRRVLAHQSAEQAFGVELESIMPDLTFIQSNPAVDELNRANKLASDEQTAQLDQQGKQLTNQNAALTLQDQYRGSAEQAALAQCAGRYRDHQRAICPPRSTGADCSTESLDRQRLFRNLQPRRGAAHGSFHQIA